jgi:threonyl-tRNA synthetase
LVLRQVLEARGLSYETDKGGGAFYGPKIDIKIKDSLDREWQLTTIQFDFNLPERFDMVFTGKDGRLHRPYMVHRALLGAWERFFGLLIEHYAGAFPLWLAPVQVKILTISEKFNAYAADLAKTLTGEGIRYELDLGAEKLGYKIRQGRLERVPYLIIIGEKEVKEGTLSLRSREKGDEGAVSLPDLVKRIKEEVALKK